MEAKSEIHFDQERHLNKLRYSSRLFDNPYHFHDSVEIAYIIQGSGTLISGKEVFHYQPNDLIFISSKLPHRFITDNQSSWATSLLVQFSPDLFSEALLSLDAFKSLNKLLNNQWCTFIKSTQDKELLQHMETLIETESSEVMSSLIAVLEYIAKDLDSYSTQEDGQYTFEVSRVDPVLTWLRSNYRQEITTTQLAKIVSMDTSSFCRQFKSATGMTVREYTNQLRITDAYSQLISTNRSISDIAFDVGYASSPVFCRNFRKVFGVSATTVRQCYV
ncbi:helix-turn-helix domain-containing protein [Vibrio sp. WXL103]|uniref:helix-turn-helix domain-containing protein n=1 Tax=Vibrio sp. WXL103 TaxID=3450710 RepID=UPI003EC4B1EE